MRTQRFAGIALGVFWLILLVVFSAELDTVSQIAIYALLVTFIGYRRAQGIQWDDGTAVMNALALGAALNFGPGGGAVIGALIVFAQITDAHTAIPPHEVIARSLFGAISGGAAGLAAHHTVIALSYGLPAQIAAVMAGAVALIASQSACRFAFHIRGGIQAASKRAISSRIFSADLAVGFGLAATTYIIHAAFGVTPVVLALPIVYLIRLLFNERVRQVVSSTDGPSDNLAGVYLSAMRALVAAIDARDRFSRMHTTNVVALAMAIGKKMDLDEEALDGLRNAALFHDIGKLWVPEHILLKPGKLDQQQFAKVQCHPALGQRILDNVNFPWSVGEIVRSHHERFDGSGYPDHLQGEEIPLGARVLCLADVFDAMMSKRLYRPSNNLDETLRYIRASAGTHFDPAVVLALNELIADNELPEVYRTSQPGAVSVIEAGDPADVASVTGSEFVALFEIAQAAGSALELDQALNLLTEKIKGMISCSTCAIFLREPDSSIMRSAIALGDNAQYFHGAMTTLGHGQTGMVAETGRGIIAGYDGRDLSNPTLERSKATLSRWVTPASTMIVPMVTDQGVIGTINLYHTKCVFSEEDLLLLTAVASEVGKAIQKARLFQQTSETALTDAMTGLHNARYMSSQLEKEINLARCLNRPLSVLCMDLDNFKAVNDTLGHQQGDEVLRDMAKIFLTQVRDGDLVCRYAGDEFIIVLPGSDRMEALMTKRRIEVAADALEPYGTGVSQVRVGVSIGVATFPDDGQDMQSLIACADANMYAAKKARKHTEEAA